MADRWANKNLQIAAACQRYFKYSESLTLHYPLSINLTGICLLLMLIGLHW